MIVWGANTLLCTAWSALWGKRSPGSSSGFDVATMLASVDSPGAVRVSVLEEAVSLRADTEPGRQEMGIGHRVVVHRSNSRSPSPGVDIRKPYLDPLFPET